MIEHLPQELRDRFTEMREMDLSVQSKFYSSIFFGCMYVYVYVFSIDNMDSLEKRVRQLFNQCRRNEIQGTAADVEFSDIKKDYYRVLEDADEKVTIANQSYDLVDRYLHKLDEELHKFKCELEADHNGITEILEKRAMEMENSMSSSSGSQKENRYFGSIGSGTGMTSEPRHLKTDGRYKHNKPEKRRDSTSLNSGPVEKRPTLTASLSTPLRTGPGAGLALLSASTTPSLPYNIQHLGANNAIAAAASQAIVATQQMPQGRRTASLKASIEAITASNLGSPEIVIGRELAGATQNVIQAVERETNSLSNQKRHKKKLGANTMLGGNLTIPGSSISQIGIQNPEPEIPAVVINDSGMVVEQTAEGEWTYDPNEPRYCICNQVSYGDMVACDNEDVSIILYFLLKVKQFKKIYFILQCPFEWFHYPCVGITSSPKGKWYCPQCSAAMRRQRGGQTRKI